MCDEGEVPPPSAEEAPPAEAAPAEAPPAEPPALPTEVDKKESHVRVQEPGEGGEAPKFEEQARKPSIQASALSAGRRESLKRTESSKEGLRRRSDRPSKVKTAIGSTISFGKGTGYGDFAVGTKAPKFMNTFKLDSDKPFHVETVERILHDVLIEALDDLVYDPDKCPKQAKWATSAIRARVKEQEFDRYKLIILVTIGEKRYHDMCSVFRFLWDIDRDRYAIGLHENMFVFASAICFAVYYE